MGDEKAIAASQVETLKLVALAMNRAAITFHFDQARACAGHIAHRADKLGLSETKAAALSVIRFLGDQGMPPTPGFGQAMLRLADLLSQLRTESDSSPPSAGAPGTLRRS